MTSQIVTTSPLQKSAFAYSTSKHCPSDNSFGPFSNCRFDFALSFEQWILSGIPSTALLLASAIRLYQLHGQDQKVVRNYIGLFKLTLSVTYVLIQLIIFILWTRESSIRVTGTLPIAALNLAASISIVPLFYREHARSIRPSTLLELYFSLSSLFDMPQVRTLSLFDRNTHLLSALITSICCKLAMLVLEARGKREYLQAQYQPLSPESLSGFFSRSFLWWLNGIFSARYRDFVHQYELDHELSTQKVGVKMQRAWNLRKTSDGERRFSLIWAMCRGLGSSFACVLFPRLCLIGFTFAQPFLITSVLDLLKTPKTERTRLKGYLLIISTLLIYLGIAVSSLHSKHALNRFITTFRGAFVYLIYDKALLLKSGSYDESSALTLMGADVDRIAFCLEELNECWSRLIEIGIGLPLLARQLGWVSVIPFIVVALSTIGSSVVAKLIGKAQKTWSDATQSRVKATTSMLKEMKSVKMTGLTDVLGDLIQTERIKETKKMEKWAWIIVWLNVFANIPVMLAPAATFGVYAIQSAIHGSESLNTVQAFTSLALISLVSYPASRLLSAIPNTAASLGCFDRIQAFLVAHPYYENRVIDSEPQDRGEPAIEIKGATISPSKETDFVLRDVNVHIPKGNLVIVAGPVGAGKATLLKAMLGEIECSVGNVTISDEHVAYCSQTPWLINGTIKQAICSFGNEDVDEIWYKMVLNACDLTYDVSKLVDGDGTIIGSRGVKLSGGQNQRVAIARAVYSKRRIVLMDDVLSALDMQTETKVISQLFGRDTGSGAGLLRRLGCTVVLVTHSTQTLPVADQIITIDSEGKISCDTPKDLSRLRNEFTQFSQDANERSVTVDEKDEVQELEPDKVEEEVETRDLERKTGDFEVYKYYYKSIGFTKLLVFFVFVLLNVFSGSFSQIWLKWWTDHDGRQIALYSSVYLVLAIGYSVGMGGYAWAMAVVIGPSTGRKLHRVLLNTVLRAPQSFFNVTDLGSILNRFVQDMSLIEGQLAYGVLATVSNLFSTLAEAALIATGSPFVIIALPPLFIVMYYLQQIYLRTSRQLRHLELESRGPIYSHFLETIEGISTIRAFGWERECQDLFERRVHGSQKPYYLMFCIQNWLGLVLDLISAGMAVTVVSLALNLRHWTSPGLLGVAMNNVLSFNLSLGAFLSGWTVLETSLGAIARLKDFEAETEVEDILGESTVPPENWPLHGAIEFESVSVEYNGSVKALKEVTLNIEPGQHVSICGRTGSGKSTLLSTIARLQDVTGGTIKIDSLDLSKLSHSAIRQQITSISQDALHLDGTLRFNLDPFNRCTVPQIISALTKVDPLCHLHFEEDGIDTELKPDTLSKGQFQLSALARALLRKSKVVLMDEATSSIDTGTAKKIGDVIRKEFQGSTVLKVAHRKETILNADLVVVMELGEIVEKGDPELLMADEGSKLRALVESGDWDGIVY